MKRCEKCLEEIHITVSGGEYGHEPPCDCCERCGGRIKEKDGYRFCENWETCASARVDDEDDDLGGHIEDPELYRQQND